MKLSPFADDMTFYIENPKDSTRKLPELINEYSEVAGYKINTQKSLAFLYTKNEKPEREIKETIPFTIATKRIKYLGIYISKETKDLYIENYNKPVAADAAIKSLQSSPTLSDPINGSPPGSPIPGIFQAKTLEWQKYTRGSSHSFPDHRERAFP